MPQVAELLRAWRQYRQMSQFDVADSAGLDRNSVGRYERDEHSPTLENLARIAKGLGITLREFFAGPPGFGTLDTVERPSAGQHHVPLFASLPAGGWDSSEAVREGEILVPDWLIPDKPGIVAVRVRGDSMAPKIEDGSIVFLDTTRANPHSGEIVAAYLDGELTLKVFRRQDRKIVLEPWNRRNYVPIEVDDVRHLRIAGVYIGHWTPGR